MRLCLVENVGKQEKKKDQEFCFSGLIFSPSPLVAQTSTDPWPWTVQKGL